MSAVTRVCDALWRCSADAGSRLAATSKKATGVPGLQRITNVLRCARDTGGEICLFRGHEPARAFSMKSVRSTFFQSGIAEIFFSLSSASAWPVM
jgi:hypothetical protein